MKLVVADTSPVNYLVLIGNVDVLRALFNQVLIPSRVFDELSAPAAPSSVADWIKSAPPWITVVTDPGVFEAALPDRLGTLDAGELAAIQLAISVARQDSLLLMDDAAGRAVARDLGLATIGTLGILALAARRGFLDLRESLARLQETNFRVSDALIAQVIKEHAGT